VDTSIKMGIGGGKMIRFKIMASICLAFLFFLGLLLMDYGASLNNIKGQIKGEIYGQSLVFSRVEPRIMYHTGLVLCLASFLSLELLFVNEICRETRTEVEK